MRVVMDSNQLVSAYLIPKGIPARVLAYWQNNKFELVLSRLIRMETEEVLNRPRLHKRHGRSPAQVRLFMDDLEQAAIMVAGNLTLSGIVEDPDDDMVIACAVEGEADYIITGDAKLLAVSEFKGIRIITAREMLDILET